MVIVGSEVFGREDAAGIHAAVSAIAQKSKLTSQSDDADWRVLNVLHKVMFCTTLFIF